MLNKLIIRNIVLIEHVEIEFQSGFSVLTGETGAGKSIMLDALGLAMGDRADISLVRAGKNNAQVIAEFDISSHQIIKEMLAENDIEHEDLIYLKRSLNIDGKSRAAINDIPVSIGFLKMVAEELIEITNQTAKNGLLNPKTHLALLDQYAGNGELQKTLSSKFSDFKKIAQKIDDLKKMGEKSALELDYLRHIYQELKDLSPKTGEEEELSNKRAYLRSSEDFTNMLTQAIQELSSSKLFSVQKILSKFKGELPAKTQNEMNIANDLLEKAMIDIAEITEIFEKLRAEAINGSESLDEIEERLFLLRAASRKYKIASDDLPAFINEVEKKLHQIENSDELIKKLEKEFTIAKAEYFEIATKISKIRKETASKMAHLIESELAYLRMENTKFKVEFTDLEEENWNINGVEKVTFLAATNNNIYGEIQKIASGGELSRLLLAIKLVLTKASNNNLLIFDEIDTGIGGAVADAVGRRLKNLGDYAQVIAITHQPQVASKASHHYKIAKSIYNGMTITGIRKLSANEQQEEIARMISGENITEQARAAAGSLIAD